MNGAVLFIVFGLCCLSCGAATEVRYSINIIALIFMFYNEMILKYYQKFSSLLIIIFAF